MSMKNISTIEKQTAIDFPVEQDSERFSNFIYKRSWQAIGVS